MKRFPSLEGRGQGWVARSANLRHNRKMRRIDPEMTRRARELRGNATDTERTLWRLLSCYRPPFTRQLVVGRFILDLACREAKLAVEIDGSQHVDNQSDADRTCWLEADGWSVIRFWNNDVRDNPRGVAEAILLAAAKGLGGTHPQPLPSREGRKRVLRVPD